MRKVQTYKYKKPISPSSTWEKIEDGIGIFIQYGNYQCPTCNGTGRVSRPSWITGEQVGLGSSTTEATWWSAFDPGPYLCQACKGGLEKELEGLRK